MEEADLPRDVKIPRIIMGKATIKKTLHDENGFSNKVKEETEIHISC